MEVKEERKIDEISTEEVLKSMFIVVVLFFQNVSQIKKDAYMLRKFA